MNRVIVIKRFCIACLLLAIGFFVLLYTTVPEHTYIDSFFNNRILVLSETHQVVDIKKKQVITDRLLTAGEFGNELYALSKRGYVIYDLDTGTETLFTNENTAKDSQNGLWVPGMDIANVVTKKSLDSFSPQERKKLQAMFSQPKRDSFYYHPFYESPYEKSLVDVRKNFQISTVYKRSLKNGVLYVYGGKNLLIIDNDKQNIKYYYNPLLDEEENTFLPDPREKIKKIYGEEVQIISTLSDLSSEEKEALKAMWIDYHDQKKPHSLSLSELEKRWEKM